MTARRDEVPDVSIIGGGIVGSAAAAFLAAEGVAVTLYERTEIAAAASGRNSGVIQHPFDPVLVALYRVSLELYRELADAVGPRQFALAAEPSGLMLIGRGEAAFEAAGELVNAWSSAYPATKPRLVAGSSLRALEPTLADGLAACRLDVGYPVAPAAATSAFAALAAARGARIVVGSDVRPVLVHEGTVAVEVDGRREPAGAIVVAAGPWTPALFEPLAHIPIVRSWGVVAQVELEAPPRHVLEEIEIDIEPGEGRTRPGPADEAGVGFSLVTSDRSSALGSTFLEERPDPADYIGRLRARGSAFVPRLATAPVTGTRVCARPVSVDGRPLVGRVPGAARTFVASGNGPWGISTGPATARLVADLVLGRSPAVPSELDPARFAAPAFRPN